MYCPEVYVIYEYTTGNVNTTGTLSRALRPEGTEYDPNIYIYKYKLLYKLFIKFTDR